MLLSCSGVQLDCRESSLIEEHLVLMMVEKTRHTWQIISTVTYIIHDLSFRRGEQSPDPPVFVEDNYLPDSCLW